MGKALLWFLLLLPVVEIAVFIEVGSRIGAGATVGLIVLSAVLGVLLLRRQGLSVLRKAQMAADRGELPVGAVFEGFCVAVGAILLIIPGFLTDAVAVLLLIPPLRNALGLWLFERMRRKGGLHVWMNGREVDPRHPSRRPAGRPSGVVPGEVIDVDYREVDPPGDDADTPKLGESRWGPKDPRP
ncbi:MAG TPA: FxsA family protein [Azospirillum sp.]|nr:FxsA family protein [Azospirillum sp.]